MTATTIETAAGPVPGHLSVPAGAGPWPGVVVVHEAFGLNDDIRGIADRFAAAGYLAFAPDLLSGGTRAVCLIRTFRALTAGHGPAVDQLLGCRQWLAARQDSTGRIGVAGFCLGGGFALLLAPRGFQAAAAQYGIPPRDITQALRGSCPVVASYGGKDRFLAGTAARLEAALSRAGVPHDVKEYPQAGHSFMNAADTPLWMRPISRLSHAGYVDTAATDAWQRILAMFATALGGADEGA